MPLTADSGSQTDTHILDTFIDPAYQWNEWEMRRRALLLVKLKKKATSATQTIVSEFRRDSEAQCWGQKDKDTQTRKDAGTNVSRRVQYIAGLRGCTQEVPAINGQKTNPSSGVRVVDLTLNL
jgi:hypothetical protein